MQKLLPAFLIFIYFSASAQQMHVKRFNFSTFNTGIKVKSTLLDEKSSAEAKKHPEYGILPYNAQCAECVELIDKRTLNSRLFIDPKNAGHTYSQSSYFPLHYKKSEHDVWRTIDRRLQPDAAHPGVYTANNQPLPTKCDLNKRTVSINKDGYEFEFNKNLSMYFFDETTVYTETQKGDYSNYTIGEEGLLVKNIWKGIDMEQAFGEGQVETNYVINAPLQLPIKKGWMVIEDHFSLPEGYTIVETGNGDHLDNGYYRGDYTVMNDKGESQFKYDKSVYVDAKAFGMPGVYKLIKAGNDYTLQTLIPVEWLSKADNTYPLVIDPTVEGFSSIGYFTSSGQTPAVPMGFTSMPLGYCPYSMVVIVPGKSRITKSYVGLEYKLTYNNTCGTPHEAPPYCTFSQVTQEVISTDCGTTTGILTCNPANPPYTGTCTTDSLLVPGAHTIQVNNYNPNYLSCIAPQCADYQLTFNLRNQDSICGDQCDYLCAKGNMWLMTVEGELVVSASIVLVNTSICPGQTDTAIASASNGVPPYNYIWTTDDGSTFDTIYGSNIYVFTPTYNSVVYCFPVDSCWGIGNPSNSIHYTVHSGPDIIEMRDTLFCSSGYSNYQWYLNGTAISGATSSFYPAPGFGQYTVKADDIYGCQQISSAPFVTAIGNIFANENSISILPNPSSGNFIVRIMSSGNAQGAYMKLFDDLGRVIITKDVNISTGQNSFAFDSKSQLAKGNYWLEVTAGKEVARKNVVIE